MKRSRLGSPSFILALAFLFASACAPAAPPSPSNASKTAEPAVKSAPAAVPAAQSADKTDGVSFQGKTITLLVPWSPGGSADIMARQFAPTFEKYLPGNPTVIIQNMPGAGEVMGENWLYNAAPKDGTVIGQFSSAIDNALLNADQVKFDLAKLQWLGSVAETRVAFVNKSLGITEPKGLVDSSKKIVFGGTAPSSTRDMGPRLFLGLIGADFKYVSGFGSSGDMRAALRRGEINMTIDSLSGYSAAVVPMVEEGVVFPIAQQGIIKDGKVVRDPRVSDVSTYQEVLLALKGEGVKESTEYRALDLLIKMNGFTRGFVYPAGVPEPTVAAVRAAIGKALEDPALRADYQKSVGIEVVSLTGKETQDSADSVVALIKSNPEALDRLKQLANEGT